jgi:hypothetical protein
MGIEHHLFLECCCRQPIIPTAEVHEPHGDHDRQALIRQDFDRASRSAAAISAIRAVGVEGIPGSPRPMGLDLDPLKGRRLWFGVGQRGRLHPQARPA